MALEMLASRILAPYFGTSLLIWPISSLWCLSRSRLATGLEEGFQTGYPFKSALLKIVLLAGVSCLFVPLASARLLPFASYGISSFSPGILPCLSFVCPLAVRCPYDPAWMVSPFWSGSAPASLRRSGTLRDFVCGLDHRQHLRHFRGCLHRHPLSWLKGKHLCRGCVASCCLSGRLGKRPRLLLAVLVLGLLALPGGAIKEDSRLLLEGESGYNYYQVIERTALSCLKLNEA